MRAMEGKQCSRCGAAVAGNALWGMCHRCLFDEATALPENDGALNAKNRRFADYELGAQLGRGGMGVVYEAVQISLRRPVALKMILDAEADSPVARRRFRVEAEAAAKLDHPNIVPIYEIGEHEAQAFLSMKFIAGTTLREKIVSGDLCLKPQSGATSRTDLRQRLIAIVKLIATIARAVDHAHSKNVLHRDLKPSNILVDREGQPHLTDFGLAKLLEREGAEVGTNALTVSGTTLGTPSYMSPEQAAGHRVTAASDIYSLGAILYEMLTGAPPFKAPTVLETLRMVADQQPRRPSTINTRVDRDLETICLKCLEKNASSRYATALDLAEDLERWLRQEPIRARPAGWPLRARRWVNRNRPATALIITLFAGFTLALTLWDDARRQRKILADIAAINTQKFNEEVERLWADANKTYIHVDSERLAQLVNAAPKPPNPEAQRIIYAAVVSADPFGQAQKYAPVLTLLERKMQKLTGRPTFIDLRLYKFNGDGGQAPVTLGEVDFQRLGPLRYIQAKAQEPKLELVVSEILPKEAVFYARNGLGITNMNRLHGHKLAFAHTNSTVSFLTKAILAQHGYSARDFAIVSNITVNVWAPNREATESGGRVEFESETDGYAHREVTRQVSAGKFDLGEAPRRHFEMNKHRKRGLAELHAFKVIPDVVVARGGLPAEQVRAFREALLSFRSQDERGLLAQLKHALEGYSASKDSDYDILRSMATNEVVRFDFQETLAQTNALTGTPRAGTPSR